MVRSSSHRATIEKHVPSSLKVVIVLLLLGVAGCRSKGPIQQCSTLTLQLSWFAAAADDESIRVDLPTDYGGALTWQTFPVQVGATHQTVMVDLSQRGDITGRTIGVTVSHATVVLMVSGPITVRDPCAPITIDSWDVDAAVAPQPHD